AHGGPGEGGRGPGSVGLGEGEEHGTEAEERGEDPRGQGPASTDEADDGDEQARYRQQGHAPTPGRLLERRGRGLDVEALGQGPGADDEVEHQRECGDGSHQISWTRWPRAGATRTS